MFVQVIYGQQDGRNGWGMTFSRYVRKPLAWRR